MNQLSVQFSSLQLFSHAQLFVTPWTAAHQASLSVTNSQSLFKLMSIKLVMPSNHFILCRPLLLLPSIFPSSRVFANDSVLRNQVAKVLEFQLQHHSLQRNPRADLLQNGLVRFSPDTKSATTLILDFSTSRILRNKCLPLKASQSVAFFFF